MVDVVVAGAINWDINLFVRSFPRPGEEMVVEKITRVPGGKAGNVAVAAARLLGPDKVAIVSALGGDDVADEQVEIFRSEGVETRAIRRRDGTESGQAYIVIDQSGENIIHTYFGANATLSSPDFEAQAVRESIEESRIVTVMDPPVDAIERLTAMAHSGGKLIAWDPGVRSKFTGDQLGNVLQRVSYLVVNEVETEYLTGTQDPEAASSHLLKKHPHLKIILKRGGEGCILRTSQITKQFKGPSLERLGLKVVNTVGCGDAFLGAFVAAKSEGKTDEDGIVWANAAGAFKATRMETRGSPTRNELDDFLKLAGVISS